MWVEISNHFLLYNITEANNCVILTWSMLLFLYLEIFKYSFTWASDSWFRWCCCRLEPTTLWLYAMFVDITCVVYKQWQNGYSHMFSHKKTFSTDMCLLVNAHSYHVMVTFKVCRCVCMCVYVKAGFCHTVLWNLIRGNL